MKNQPILVGILAGLAAGLMMLAAYGAGVASIPFLFAAPASIYIASMGWGTVSGFIAALVAAGIILAIGTPGGAIVSSALLFIPAAWTGHLANLGQQGARGMIWYPLSGILFQLMLLVAAGFIITGLVTNYSSGTVTPLFVELFKELGGPGQPVSDELLVERAELYAALIPLVLPAMWLMMHVLVAWLSAMVARRSGLMPRPQDDIPASANLPLPGFVFLAAGLGGAVFLNGPLAMAGSVLLGTGLAGYALVGLADLHLRTRGRGGRQFILAIVYAMILLFSLPLLFFSATGALRSLAMNQNTSPNGGNDNT